MIITALHLQRFLLLLCMPLCLHLHSILRVEFLHRHLRWFRYMDFLYLRLCLLL